MNETSWGAKVSHFKHWLYHLLHVKHWHSHDFLSGKSAYGAYRRNSNPFSIFNYDRRDADS